MRFLLATLGPTSDVYPFLALGAELQAAGHQVTLLTNPRHHPAAAQAQLPLAPVPRTGAEPDLDSTFALMREKAKRTDQIEVLYAGLAPLLEALLNETVARLPEHDALVTSDLFPFLKNAARAAGRKCAVLVSCPNNIPLDHAGPEDAPAPPSWLPDFFRQAQIRRAWNATQKSLDQLVNRHLGATLRKHGLGKFQGFLRDPADLALVMVSPKLFPPLEPLPPNYTYTGFLHWQPTPDARAKTELNKANGLEYGGAPVTALTLGSMTAAGSAENFARFLTYWPHGSPLIVQPGWSPGLNDSPRPEILLVGSTPHPELFEHAVVIAHSGEASNVALALHAGRPQIILPRPGEETYWALATQALGVAEILPRANWPVTLCKALQGTLRDRDVLLRAMECAAIVRGENGAAKTARALEKL